MDKDEDKIYNSLEEAAKSVPFEEIDCFDILEDGRVRVIRIDKFYGEG